LSCRQPLATKKAGRKRRYCGDRCRQAACRKRARRKRKKWAVLSPPSSATCEWYTPPDLFAALDAEFGPFTLDACASAANAKCPRYFDREQDGLKQPWTGVVWCNPPYGRTIGEWVRKAWESVERGDAERVVCLLPARPGSGWWHDWAARGEVRFLRGRLKFGGCATSAPFDSAVVAFRDKNRVTKCSTNAPHREG
jgi:site-specific DNA-methyltransferase (adenine-specific)